MNKLIRFLPLILVLALGVVLYRGLSLNPQDMPSALVGKAMPEFSLQTLNDPNKTVTKADLKGDIVLLTQEEVDDFGSSVNLSIEKRAKSNGFVKEANTPE